MTPGARLSAATELLDAIIAAARDGGGAADSIIADYFRTRRYAGSKDRRAVRDLVWRAIRLIAERPDSGRAALAALVDSDPDLAAAFDGSAHAPPAIGADEARADIGTVPGWLAAMLDPVVTPDDWSALLERAPLDLRVNAAHSRADEARGAFPEGEAVSHLPDAIRLAHGTRIEDHPLWQAGAVEIQDAASQHAARALDARAGMTVLDLCAGAGGKTLAIAAMMSGDEAGAAGGRLVASDTNRARLSQLGPRAARAGAKWIEARLVNPRHENAMLSDLAGQCDRVIVDAPCSGSGTWRRNPELRWRLTPARLDLLAGEQARLMDIAAAMVTPGGVLLYAVCALTSVEGAGQVRAFLNRHAGWSLDPRPLPVGVGRDTGAGWLLTPRADATDGFFLARLVRG